MVVSRPQIAQMQPVRILYGQRPPSEALDVAYALSFYKEESDSPIAREIASQVLVGHNPPWHNRNRRPWLKEKAFDDLVERAQARWAQLEPDWQKKAVADEMETIRAMLEEQMDTDYMLGRKPNAIRKDKVPFFSPEHFVYGADLLFKKHADSQVWEADRILAALAAWWGITDQYMQEIVSSEGYAAEVARLDPELASTIWVQEADVSQVEMAAADVGIDVKTRDSIIGSVINILDERPELWDQRMNGENHLPYSERMKVLSSALNMKYADLVRMLTPQALLEIGRVAPGVADWIGYDPLSPVVRNSAQRVDDVDFLMKIWVLRLRAKVAEMDITAGSGAEYYDIMRYAGQEYHPYAAVYASLKFRSICSGGIDISQRRLASKIRAFVGPPPNYSEVWEAEGYGQHDGISEASLCLGSQPEVHDPDSIAFAYLKGASASPSAAVMNGAGKMTGTAGR